MYGQFFVEVIDKNEKPHRLCAGPKVEKNHWYTIEAHAEYDIHKDVSMISLEVNGQSEQLVSLHSQLPKVFSFVKFLSIKFTK